LCARGGEPWRRSHETLPSARTESYARHRRVFHTVLTLHRAPISSRTRLVNTVLPRWHRTAVALIMVTRALVLFTGQPNDQDRDAVRQPYCGVCPCRPLVCRPPTGRAIRYGDSLSEALARARDAGQHRGVAKGRATDYPSGRVARHTSNPLTRRTAEPRVRRSSAGR
jgi:hypothetical protein